MTRRKKKEEKIIRYKSVICSILNIRKEPTTLSDPVGILQRYETVECDNNFKDEEWDHIIAKSGIDGFCMKKFLEPLDPDTTAAVSEEPAVIKIQNPECDGTLFVDKENKDGNKEN